MKLDKDYLDRLISEALKKKKKEEPKEMTATGGGYGYSAPSFSMW
jgi:hypothetical protein